MNTSIRNILLTAILRSLRRSVLIPLYKESIGVSLLSISTMDQVDSGCLLTLQLHEQWKNKKLNNGNIRNYGIGRSLLTVVERSEMTQWKDQKLQQ